MTWTEKQKKEHSKRMKARWAVKKNGYPIRHSDHVRNPDGSVSLYLDVNHKPAQDMVNPPSHYTFSKYEVADVSDEWYPNEPLLWNANKYMARWDKKGDPIENLEKLIWYVQRKINQLKEKQHAQDIS